MELWWTRTQIRVNSTVIDVTWSWGVVLAVDTPYTICYCISSSYLRFISPYFRLAVVN